ncbi:hypothetical protein BGAL_0295g00050 [Botrytis galanthina]|uniref:Uncharacterized protein n=1 Tax=Botrytis galanthina TaxID=278940 RepID=A0A4S8QUU6_9HELO|nr:hypothetical protein BGAL_0295g00050 [Botrytis galanthina]
MDEDEYQREAWYTSLPGDPFIFYSENDRRPFAFREGERGSFDEGDSRTTLYGTAQTATIRNLLPYTKSAMQRTIDFVNYIEDNHFVQCNTKYWDKKIPKLFAASSSSSGESSTSNSSRETPKQKPKKDEKEAGTSITAASRTEERTQPSISPDEHRRIMEKKAADHEKKREAYEREKQKRGDEERKRENPIKEQFNADRRRHMADAREDAKKLLRDVSPGGVVLRKKKH